MSPSQQVEVWCRAWLIDGLCCESFGGRRLRWLVGELCCGILRRSKRHRCGLPQETHGRAVSTGAGSSSRRRRRRVLPTAMGHVFARPLHSSTSMLLVSMPVCCDMLAHLWRLLVCSCRGITQATSWGCHLVMRHDTAGVVVYNVPG